MKQELLGHEATNKAKNSPGGGKTGGQSLLSLSTTASCSNDHFQLFADVTGVAL